MVETNSWPRIDDVGSISSLSLLRTSKSREMSEVYFIFTGPRYSWDQWLYSQQSWLCRYVHWCHISGQGTGQPSVQEERLWRGKNGFAILASASYSWSRINHRKMGILLFVLMGTKRFEKVGCMWADKTYCYGDIFVGYIFKWARNFWQWRVKLSLTFEYRLLNPRSISLNFWRYRYRPRFESDVFNLVDWQAWIGESIVGETLIINWESESLNHVC